MKKFGYFVLSLALAMACLCALVACGGKAGTYKLSSMKVSVLGVSTEVKTGEEYEGETLSEDMFTIELKNDGAFVLKVSEDLGLTINSVEGTWKENEDDANKIELMVGEATVYTLKYESGTLVMSIDMLVGKVEITFKK